VCLRRGGYYHRRVRPGGAAIRRIDSPDDADLQQLSALMNVTFPDPNTVLGLDRMQEFLAANRPGAARRFCVLVATDPGRAGAVVGGSVFSYVARSICGFSEYILVDRRVRGTGLGRRLFDARKEVLDEAARRAGHGGCRGLFIEADNPERVPADFAEIERETALDAWERLRLFDHLGFRRVDVPYVQPPLAPDKEPIDYLDLLFAPWPAHTAISAIPAQSVLDTLEPVWLAWSPATATEQLALLRERISSDDVALVPLSAPSS
jgi:GNAT superfamily N-acetyltransferase